MLSVGCAQRIKDRRFLSWSSGTDRSEATAIRRVVSCMSWSMHEGYALVDEGDRVRLGVVRQSSLNASKDS